MSRTLEYELPDGSNLLMTLRRLKAIAIVLPVAGVIALELVRFGLIGGMSWEKRIALDLVFVLAIVVFSTVIFRVVDQMQQRLRRQNEELLALHTAGLDVTGQLSLEVVLKKVVEQAKNLVGARYGALSVVDRHGRIQSFITSGISPKEREAIGPPPVGHGLLGVVLNEGQHLRLGDLTKHPLSQGFPANHPPMRSLLAVPIPCKSPFLGNLYLTEKLGPGDFEQDDEDTLQRFAIQAALAIDNAHLHEQVADLATAQERIRISHEMHDGLAQVLGYVNTKVQAVEKYLERGKIEDATEQLHELGNASRQAYLDVRESIVGLRTLPGQEQPISEVLGQYMDAWAEMSHVTTSMTIDAELYLRPNIELQLVRIVQEALTNVRKHAKASHAKVEVRRRKGKIVATITDDGLGFTSPTRARGELPSFGLTTMRERAESLGGTLSIDSKPGGGTVVRFEMPFSDVAGD